MKKLLLAFLLLAVLAPLSAFAADPRVAEAEQWLQNLRTGQARFAQKGYDGQILTGTFYISRPGRLRFEYDAPVKDFVVADGTLIHFYDSQQRQTSSAPIGSTLADFLLRKSARLSGDVTVQNVRERDGLLSITMVQTADPAAGQLTINFSQNPMMLKSWAILDPQGLSTEVTLTDMRLGVAIPPQYFVYKDPTGRSRLND